MPDVNPPPRVRALDRLGGVLNTRGAGLMQRLGDLETRTLADAIATQRIDRPVYVCGLARAGTTLLLETLASVPGMTSHRYADFPFLWTPYWWNALRRQLRLPPGAPAERAHGDRIRVTFESPEAFEEPLWMHFFAGRHDPAVNQVLDADSTAPAFERFYREHVRKLLAVRGAARYLAKGNDNLARIGYLLKLFPDARFVIAVREPRDHVASLLRQDQRFRAWSQQDPRIGRQLVRSGHHEFGPGKRALNLGDDAVAQAIQADFDAGRSVEGYARQWAACYGWLGAQLAAREEWRRACLVVPFEALCAEPVAWLTRVFGHVGMDDAAAAALATARAGAVVAPDPAGAALAASDCATIDAITKNEWHDMRHMR